MLQKDQLKDRLNAAFDEARYRLRLPNDKALAEHFGLNPKTISELRNGKWTRADEAIISMLITALCAPETESILA